MLYAGTLCTAALVFQIFALQASQVTHTSRSDCSLSWGDSSSSHFGTSEQPKPTQNLCPLRHCV